MKAYSHDLRERVVQAVEKGETQTSVAKRFEVSLATVKRYIRQWRQTGNLAPRPITGRPPVKRAALQEGVASQLRAQPDATLQEHCAQWEARSGCKVCITTMSRAIQQLGWTRKKKTLAASEQKAEDREQWRETMKTLDAAKLLFIDECGSHIALTRLYGRAKKGERVTDSIPRNKGKNVTLISSLSQTGMGASCILDGSANGDFFVAYVEQLLAPTLVPGQIVIMDNLSIHKGLAVRQAIEAKGAQLLFLPAYSPDLSPIEEAFSKLKALLRGIGARTREALQEAVAQALEAITADDACGWFRHCGYLAAPAQPQDLAG